MWLTVFVLLLGFALLTKGSDWLVDGASDLARSIGVSEFIIGITVISVGTSLPELSISSYASFIGSGGISVGNVIGSNVMNIALIVGIAALIRKIKIRTKIAQRDLVLLIGSAFVCFPLMLTGTLSRLGGLLLISIYIAYTIELMVSFGRRNHAKKRRKSNEIGWKPLFWIMIGVFFVIMGARLSISSALEIAKVFQIPERIIGLTLIALGTSLPELATSITASLKGKGEMAIGNIAGSNAFNILGVLGFSALVKPIPIEAKVISIDLPLMLIASLFFLFIWDRDVTRFEGVVLLSFFAAYMMILFAL